MEANTLQHFGILGMRWGVRRYQNPDGSLTPAGRRRYDVGDPNSDTGTQTKTSSIDSQRAVQLRSKGLDNLTNDELSDVVRRMNLEKNYKDLTRVPSNYEKAMNFTKKVINTVETANKVYQLTQSQLIQDLAKKVVKK